MVYWCFARELGATSCTMFLLFLQSLGCNYGGVLGLLFELKKLTQIFCDFWVLVLHKTPLGIEPKPDATWKKLVRFFGNSP